MRKSSKWIVAILCVVAALLFFAPFLIGMGIQQFVDIRSLFFGWQNNVDIRVVEYRRGWFSSDVTTLVSFSNPVLREVLIELGVSHEKIPEKIELVFSQHIQHGPFFYAYNQNLPCFYGIAAIDRKLIIPPNQQEFFSTLELSNSFWQADQMLLGFTGNIFNHIKLAHYAMKKNQKDLILGFNALEANVWSWPASQRIKGNVTLDHFNANHRFASLFVPSLYAEFDLQKNSQNLWMGHQLLNISEIVGRDKDNQPFALNDLKIDGFVNEAENLLDSNKEISLNKIEYRNNIIGPVNVVFSLNRIRAQAITDLMEAYKNIKLQGELYESQLRQKILGILPTVFTSGSSISLKTLSVMTPEGSLKMNATITWPTVGMPAPSTMDDFLEGAKMQGNLQISKPLINSAIKLMAKALYARQIPPEQHDILRAMRSNILAWVAQNASTIERFAEAHMIPQADAKELLSLLESGASTDYYFMAVKKYYFTKDITRETALLLEMQYSPLMEQADNLTQQLALYENAVETQTREQIADLVKQGIVVLDNDNYVVSVTRENNTMKVNGHVVN